MITVTKSVSLTISPFLVANQSIRRTDCCSSATSCQDRTMAVCNWLSVCCCGRVDIKLTSISSFSCWVLNNVRSRCISSSDSCTRSILSISSDPNICYLCICKYAIKCPLFMSCGGNWVWPSKKGGILSFIKLIFDGESSSNHNWTVMFTCNMTYTHTQIVINTHALVTLGRLSHDCTCALAV